MSFKTALYFALVAIALVAMLHVSGLHFYFYWRIPWYDRIVHVIAGFAVVFFTYYISRSLSLSVIGALVVGVAWEVFEIQSGYSSMAHSGYIFDTIGDLVSDVVGGTVALLYILKK